MRPFLEKLISPSKLHAAPAVDDPIQSVAEQLKAMPRAAGYAVLTALDTAWQLSSKDGAQHSGHRQIQMTEILKAHGAQGAYGAADRTLIAGLKLGQENLGELLYNRADIQPLRQSPQPVKVRMSPKLAATMAKR